MGEPCLIDALWLTRVTCQVNLACQPSPRLDNRIGCITFGADAPGAIQPAGPRTTRIAA
jgi:hypothetical protein